MPNGRAWLVAIPLAVTSAFVCGLLVRLSEATRFFFAENGPVELLQTGFLAVIALVFLLAFRRSSDSRAFFCLAMAYAIAFAITREVPRCDSAFYEGGVCMSGDWKTGTVVVVSIAALVVLGLAPIVWRRALRISNVRWVWPVFLVAGIIGLAEASETLLYVEIEELLELAAYACLGVFGLQVLSNARRAPQAAFPHDPGRRTLR